ncbi:MAG: glycoside hydrolase family 172 protein [Bryobacteraceae bacterium]
MKPNHLFALIAVALVLPAFAQTPDGLSGIATFKNAATKRISSWDKTGGNSDRIPIKPGETATLAEISGAGCIKHIWVTIASESKFHLRELVLRMYWDGEAEPSVETPIGDFFGTGFGAYKSWWSAPLTVQGKAMNSYFPMPFGSGARVTVTNEGEVPVRSFYYHIDYEEYGSAAQTADMGRFHVQWRRENPTKAIPVAETKGINPTGKDNYLFMDATGRGQFAGVVLHVLGHSTGWWGEGDDMFFVDGQPYPPSIYGTGLEDYFNNAWGFQEEFNYPYIGYSLKGNKDWTGMHSMYRFHIPDPIHFKTSLRATIEHGHANDRADDYSSTAYWYQTEPHKKLEPLPVVKDRYPTQFYKIEVLEKNLPN